jgi:UDP-N-acetylglucosamine transferase subunit ALG13
LGNSTLEVDYFTFSPSIADYIREASLAISHAGDHILYFFRFETDILLNANLYWLLIVFEADVLHQM